MNFKALRDAWDANPHSIHKRPPFRAHSFDNNAKFYVVGSTRVSVVARHYCSTAAQLLANQLNL